MLEITDSSVALSAKGRHVWGEVLTFLRPQPTPWTFLTDCCSYFFGFQIISVNYALFKDVFKEKTGLSYRFKVSVKDYTPLINYIYVCCRFQKVVKYLVFNNCELAFFDLESLKLDHFV